jgi:eukaryotic-like serine/threonine-protein kinase
MIGKEIGRYVIGEKIASGGMANVHIGRIRGAAGFVRSVAIKSLHPALTKDADTVATLIDEAHVASNIRHPKVVPILDVLTESGELFLVMEYVHGESLAQLIKEVGARRGLVPIEIAVGIVVDFLEGLHAAHEATDQEGKALEIVHRDVAPKNIMVGVDGVSRVVDFGIAKASVRAQTTQEGQLKGTLGYMSPEQLKSQEVDRRADVFASGVVLWELLTGKRLFQADNPGEIVGRILLAEIPLPSKARPDIPPAIDDIVMTALMRDPTQRYATAEAFAEALTSAVSPATSRAIGAWVDDVARETLASRAQLLRATPSPDQRANAHAEEPTGPTSVSVDKAATILESMPPASGSDRATKSPKLARSIGIVVALALVTLFVWFGWIQRESGTSSRAPQTATPADAPMPAATMGPSDSPPALGASVPIIEAAPSVMAPTRPAVPWKEGPFHPRPAQSEKKSDCDPPYVMRGGIKQFKPACL